jgi:antitoxin HicB
MIGYWIKLEPDDNGTFLVTCPVLPEVTTFGETTRDATSNAIGAIEEALAARMDAWREVPPLEASSQPGEQDLFAPLSSQTIAKVLLLQRLHQLGLTRAELQRRMNVHREQVDRLFRLDHASQLNQLDAAFRALGSVLSLSVEQTAA